MPLQQRAVIALARSCGLPFVSGEVEVERGQVAVEAMSWGSGSLGPFWLCDALARRGRLAMRMLAAL